MEKKLYRAKNGATFAGVCAGIANFFSLDPVLVRVIFAALSIFGGGGINLYVSCARILPLEP